MINGQFCLTLSSFDFMVAVIYYILGLLTYLNPGLDTNSNTHAIYVSVVEISYVASHENGKMKVKLFTDDLEDAILNQTGTKVKLSRHCERNLDIVSNYLQHHLVLSINRKEIDYSIIDCEIVDISTWFEFTFTCEENWQSIDVMGDQLMELFPTQSNVFSVKYNDQKRMFRLTNSKKATTLTFN